MISRRHSGRCLAAFTWVELLVVLGIVAVLACLILPALKKAQGRTQRIGCVSRLKQIGTAFRLYANDYDGAYPYIVLATNATAVTNLPFGVSFQTNDPSLLWMLYQTAGNELSSPIILACPADAERQPASDFEIGPGFSVNSFSHPGQRQNALSYFYGMEAMEDNPNLLVTGDRHIYRTAADGKSSLLTGAARLGSSRDETKSIGWGSELHGVGGGNVGFSDGSVQQLSSVKLREALFNSATNNVVWLPNTPPASKP